MSSQVLTLQQVYDLCYKALRDCGASESEVPQVLSDKIADLSAV